MRNTLFMLIIFLLELIFLEIGNACTTAIISGKATPDGRPLLWKHRDSDHAHNTLRFFSDGTFPYIGLVNADDLKGKQIWAGCNNQGFAIMNAASYNLRSKQDTTRLKDQEGVIMKLALQTCRTLTDFEHLLNTLPKPLGVESNFGVIDAQGGAAYYETDNFSFHKLDVNNPAIAPEGYLIHTNFSFTGRLNGGMGYIRYAQAEHLFHQAAAQNQLNVRFLLQKVSRNLEHGLTGRNLKNEQPANAQNTHFVLFRDFIPRHSSVSVMVVQGVKKGQNPNQTVIWSILGFPLASVALPLWVAAGPNLPHFLLPDANGTAPLCEAALHLKSLIFPIKRGSGPNYLNLAVLMNCKETGILQRILPFESKIISKGEELNTQFEKTGFKQNAVLNLYRQNTARVKEFYFKQWNIRLGKN